MGKEAVEKIRGRGYGGGRLEGGDWESERRAGGGAREGGGRAEGNEGGGRFESESEGEGEGEGMKRKTEVDREMESLFQNCTICILHWYENNIIGILLIQLPVDSVAKGVPSYSVKKYKYNVKKNAYVTSRYRHR